MPTKQALTLADEFKSFALKGNVVDLAVGVIIGSAFGKIVDSLVKNVIMPFINLFLPTENASYATWTVPWWWGDKGIPIGLFLADVVNFLIVSFALFLFIKKFLGFVLRSREPDKAPPPPPPSEEEKLLREIRDLLKSRAGGETPATPLT